MMFIDQARLSSILFSCTLVWDWADFAP